MPNNEWRGSKDSYRRVGAIGEGLLSSVSLVADSAQHVFALKESSDPAADLRQEADCLERLRQQPGVVQLVDRVESGGRTTALVLEHLQGYLNLGDDLLCSQGFTEDLPQALDLAAQAAEVLQAAHESQIEYNDFKPEHLFWNGRQLRVIDWNAARRLDDGSVARDLYKFGELLLHLFTGSPIPRLAPLPDISFVQSDPALLRLDYPPEQLHPSLKPLLERLLRGEYPSAAALAQELRLHAELHLKLSLPPAGILHQIEILVHRHRHAEAEVYLRQVMGQIGEQETVHELLQEVLEAQDSTLMAFRTRGEAEARAGLWDRAAQSFKLAWREDPADSSLLLRYLHCHLSGQGELSGEAHERLGQAVEAFADHRLEEALPLLKALEAERSPGLREVLGYVQADLLPYLLASLDDPDQVGPIVRFFPNSTFVQDRYAELLTEKLGRELQAALTAHNYAQARELVQRLREVDRENILAAEVEADLIHLPEDLQAGQQAVRRGDWDAAVQLLGRAMASSWVQGDEKVVRAWSRARAEQLLRQAQEARQRGAYAQAVSLVDRCRHELQPHGSLLEAEVQERLDVELRAGRAWLEYSLGEYDTAQQNLEEAMRLAPETATWGEDLQFLRRVAEGARQLSQGAYTEAALNLEEAHRLRPDEGVAARLLAQARTERNRERVRGIAYQKADAAVERGDFERALEIFQHLLLEGYASEEEVHSRVGRTLRQKAERDQERLWQQAQMLKEAGRLPAAVQTLRSLVEQTPGLPKAAETLGVWEEEMVCRAQEAVLAGRQAFTQGDLSAARKQFLEALEHTPESAEARAYLADMDRFQEHLDAGQAALAAGRLTEALGQFRRSLVLCPASPEASAALHEARRAREMRERNEQMAQHSLRRAEEAIRDGKFDEGLGYLRDLISLGGLPPETELRGRTLMVEASITAGRLVEAGQHLDALARWLEGQGWQREREMNRLRQALAQAETQRSETEQRAADWLRKARQALAEANLAEAEDAATQALVICPQHEGALTILQEVRRRNEIQERAQHLMATAQAFVSLGEIAQAERAAQRALELTPDNAETRLFLRGLRVEKGIAEAEEALRTRRFTQAQAALEQALRLDPTHAKGQRLSERIARERQTYSLLRQLVGKGNTALHLRDYRQAVEFLAQALDMNPDDAEIQARYEQALQGLQEVVATHRDLADRALQQNDFQSADAYLRVAEGLAPADPSLTSLRAGLDSALEREKALRERLQSGQQALFTGRYDTAAELLDWATPELPDESPERAQLAASAAVAREMQTLRLQARNAVEAHMYDQAISLLERILVKFPRDEESRLLLQECLTQREEATRMIQQLLKQVRQSEQSGQYDRALDLCITAENVYPWQREVTSSRQRIHKLQTLLELMQRALQLGNTDEAWSLARQGNELNPYDNRFQQVVQQSEYASRVAEARRALERGQAGEAVNTLAALMEAGVPLKQGDRDLWEVAASIAASEESLLQGDYTLAEDALRPSAREHPVGRRLWQRIRRARRLSEQGHRSLDQAGDLDEAERCFRLILADQVEDERAREGLRRVISSRVEKLHADSESALDRGDSATALFLARRALRDAPENREAQDWVETCERLHNLLTQASRAYADGDRATALSHWSQAVQLHPSPAVVALVERVEREQASFLNRLVGRLTGRGSRNERVSEDD
ncbi:MAG: hypothetical protein GX605_03145 [Chloroflexi bacterium]|nr:hypothetical protein [Chloroflexota bacterium]